MSKYTSVLQKIKMPQRTAREEAIRAQRDAWVPGSSRRSAADRGVSFH